MAAQTATVHHSYITGLLWRLVWWVTFLHKYVHWWFVSTCEYVTLYTLVAMSLCNTHSWQRLCCRLNKNKKNERSMSVLGRIDYCFAFFGSKTTYERWPYCHIWPLSTFIHKFNGALTPNACFSPHMRDKSDENKQNKRSFTIVEVLWPLQWQKITIIHCDSCKLGVNSWSCALQVLIWVPSRVWLAMSV